MIWMQSCLLVFYLFVISSIQLSIGYFKLMRGGYPPKINHWQPDWDGAGGTGVVPRGSLSGFQAKVLRSIVLVFWGGGGYTGKNLQRNFLLQSVSYPEPLTSTAYWSNHQTSIIFKFCHNWWGEASLILTDMITN